MTWVRSGAIALSCAAAAVAGPGEHAPAAVAADRSSAARPACVPTREARVLAASPSTAVYERRRRVVACGAGRARRVLATLTLGRRLDRVAVRGDRVALAGNLSSADAFGGAMPFEITRVVDLARRTAFEQQNQGRMRALRLTAGGTAVGLERRSRDHALVAVLAQGRVLLDARASIRRVRLHGERITWHAGALRRSFDATAPVGSIDVRGPVPEEPSPVLGSFVAPVPGRYEISGAHFPPASRYETCAGAFSRSLRADAPGQRIAFALRPAGEGCRAYRGLDVTLRLLLGPDRTAVRASCRVRPTPCGGSLRVARVILAPGMGGASRSARAAGGRPPKAGSTDW